MIIIGADYHPGFQQIAFVDTDTGEFPPGDGKTMTAFEAAGYDDPDPKLN